MKDIPAGQTAASRPRTRWRHMAILLLILLLGLALRLYRLNAQSLWNDEGTSVALALRDLPTITRNAAHDIHPPLYYYLLHLWARLFGSSELAMRLLSATCGVATIGTVYALARPLDRASALLAALLCAISPFQVYYSQEARMYILVTWLGACATLALRPLLRDETPRRSMIPAYLISSVLMVYSHYLGFSVLLGHNVAMLLHLIGRARKGGLASIWPTALRWMALQVAIVVCYLPWLLLSWPALTSWPAVSPSLSFAALLAKMLQTLPFGVTILESRSTLLAGAALGALVIAGLLPPARKEHPPGASDDGGGSAGRWPAVLALCLAVPIIVLYVTSLRRPIYKQKFLLLATPAYLTLLAHGIVITSRRLTRNCGRRWGGGRRWIGVMVASLLLCILLATSARSLHNLYSDPRFSRDDYRGIVEYITAASGPDDAILINAPSQIETVDYYYRGPLPEYPLPLQRPLDAAKTETQLQEIVARHPRLFAIYWATAESDPERFIESWLDARCYKTLDAWFGDIRLVVYAVPQSAPVGVEIPLRVTLGEAVELRGYSLLTPQPRSNDILQLTLHWQAKEPIDKRYKVFVHLADSRGNIVGQRDSEPGGGGRPTSSWQPDVMIDDNYGLLVRPGTAPGRHTLRVGMYGLNDGQRLTITRAADDSSLLGNDALDLCEIEVLPATAPPPLASLDMAAPDGAVWEGIKLLGHSLHKLGFSHQPEVALHAGDLVEIILYWQREEDMPSESYFLRLERSGSPVWTHALRIMDGTYPARDWSVGEIVRDTHIVGLPPDLEPGSYRLTIAPAQGAQRDAARLQRLTIVP